jgi:OOP family OmpA-OmpF porin
MARPKKKNMTLLGLVCTATLLAGLTTACSSPLKSIVQLEHARTAYAEASAKPAITANAPVAMHDAKLALARAEAAESLEDIEYLSYLAERQVQIAVSTAEQKMAEAEIERLRRERNQILLEQRELETRQAKTQAEVRALEAETARRLAEEKTRQLEIAKEEAEARAREAEKAKRLTEQLEAEIAALQAKQTDRGIVLTLGDVLFAFNKADLQSGAIRTIEKLVEFLQKYSDRTVLIEGHTDSIGSDEYNLGLSQRRADAVRNALIERGIDRARIDAQGLGKAYPVAGNDTEAGRQRNRRVEIIISKGEETAE